jgi:hypothetical protein
MKTSKCLIEAQDMPHWDDERKAPIQIYHGLRIWNPPLGLPSEGLHPMWLTKCMQAIVLG